MNIMGTGTALNLAGQAQIGATINVPNGTASLGGSGASGHSCYPAKTHDHGGTPHHIAPELRANTSAQVVSHAAQINLLNGRSGLLRPASEG
jgi:hypothetical protein